MDRSIIAFGAIAALLAAPAAARAKPENVSWGKPYVGFASYNEDAQQCANRAFGVKAQMLPKTAEALGVLQGMSFFSFFADWAARNQAGGANISDAVRPDHVPFRNTTYTTLFRHAAYVDVVEQLQAVVDQCLVERGYRKFRLTAQQMQQLRRLKHGTPEREHFLHSLGSDPIVLTTQAI